MSPPSLSQSTQHEFSESSNPVLDGIVLASTHMELLPLIAKNTFLNPKWLAENQDIDLFRAYLSRVVVPTNSVLGIGLDIHKAFKISAYQLNPFFHNNHIAYFSLSTATDTLTIQHTTHCGVVIIGLTGLGKTHVLLAALNTVPQVIRRTGIPGMAEVTQVTWIRIDMSSIASIETLAEQIVSAIDEALKANGKVSEDTFAGVRSASAKMGRALRLMRTHYVLVLAVDEIQANNFSKAGSSDIRDWFLRIANQKIAIIFSGNPLGFVLDTPKKETDVSRYNTQQMRRLFASNRTRLDPAESILDPDWNRFIRTLATCHLDGSRDIFDEELEKLKLRLTGGFQDFYVALHSELEKLRIAAPGRTVDQQMIEQAAKNSSLIQEMQPLITAFNSKDPVALRQFTDVDHRYYLEKWRGSSESETEAERPPTPPASSSPDASEVDPIKAINADRRRIENKQNAKRKKASIPTSPIKAEVLEHHLDQLKTLITENAPVDANE